MGMELVKYFIISIVVVLSTCFLVAQGKKPPRRSSEGREVLLEHGRGFKLLAWLGGFFIAFLTFFFVQSGLEHTENLLWVLGGFLLFWILVVLGIMETQVKVALDEEGITLYSAWRGRQPMRWDDIETVRFSAASNWFVLTSKTGQKIRTSVFLKGTTTLVDYFARKLTPHVSAQAIEDYGEAVN
jgi:hypothetical protein